MSNSGKSIWAERGNKRPLIILVDNDGIPGNLDKISPSDKPPILSLKDKLNQENLNISILEGGYNVWYLSYGPLCVGKWKEKSQTTDDHHDDDKGNEIKG
jgi:hypothetical protein